MTGQQAGHVQATVLSHSHQSGSGSGAVVRGVGANRRCHHSIIDPKALVGQQRWQEGQGSISNAIIALTIRQTIAGGIRQQCTIDDTTRYYQFRSSSGSVGGTRGVWVDKKGWLMD